VLSLKLEDLSTFLWLCQITVDCSAGGHFSW